MRVVVAQLEDQEVVIRLIRSPVEPGAGRRRQERLATRPGPLRDAVAAESLRLADLVQMLEAAALEAEVAEQPRSLLCGQPEVRLQSRQPHRREFVERRHAQQSPASIACSGRLRGGTYGSDPAPAHLEQSSSCWKS